MCALIVARIPSLSSIFILAFMLNPSSSNAALAASPTKLDAGTIPFAIKSSCNFLAISVLSENFLEISSMSLPLRSEIIAFMSDIALTEKNLIISIYSFDITRESVATSPVPSVRTSLAIMKR